MSINCKNYYDCPKEKSIDTLYITNDVLETLFVGCWGTYCKKGQVTTGKFKEGKWKSQEVVYGEGYVVDSMINYSLNNNVDAVILGGDNVYSVSSDLISEEEKKLLKLGEKSSYDIDKQISFGFERCMKKVNTNNFLIGIGNHDIENCDILNKQLSYSGWNMPGLSYNVVYQTTSCSINFIFIDTNMYDKSWCDGLYPDDAEENQKKWLENILLNDHDWNIVIGHIPFLCNPHKKKGEKIKPRFEKNLYKLIQENADKIDLYMCADEHNQQYIKIDGMPPEVIAGSGGAVQDEEIFLIPDQQPQGINTLLARSVFGYVSMKINSEYINLSFLDALADEYTNNVQFRVYKKN